LEEKKGKKGKREKGKKFGHHSFFFEQKESEKGTLRSINQLNKKIKVK